MQPLFSILIANYNNSAFLHTCINSVIEQTYPNWEIILVDDYSTDDFYQAVSPYLSDSRIKIFRNASNHGCGYTKRKCASHARGRIAAFLDPDDKLEPHALETMAKAHAAHKEYSLIYSTHFICNELLEKKRIADYPKHLPENIPYLLMGDGSIHHFATFKTECYKKTEGIAAANKRAVDQDLYYKLEEQGKVLFIDEPLYHYRIHPSSISNSGKEEEAMLAHFSVIEEACLRRIGSHSENDRESRKLRRLYRTRYYKIRIFHCFRKQRWGGFIKNLFIFPFIGGWQNMVSYIRKLPVEGYSLLKKSFKGKYEIKA
jgi:glycosyltransferase involved in cell wall biosynthesis